MLMPSNGRGHWMVLSETIQSIFCLGHLWVWLRQGLINIWLHQGQFNDNWSIYKWATLTKSLGCCHKSLADLWMKVSCYEKSIFNHFVPSFVHVSPQRQSWPQPWQSHQLQQQRQQLGPADIIIIIYLAKNCHNSFQMRQHLLHWSSWQSDWLTYRNWRLAISHV